MISHPVNDRAAVLSAPTLAMNERNILMKHLKTSAALVAATLLSLAPSALRASDAQAFNVNEVSQVAPSLVHYSRDVLRKLWERTELSPRDRSLVTLAALIARAQTIELEHYVGQALDNGVNPREISEVITHLSYYASRANALSAAAVVRRVFAERKVSADQLPAAEPKLLALDEGTEAKRAQLVSESFGSTAPGLVQYTTDVLFRQVWLRPDLAPRDRSLVTVSALVASGHGRTTAFSPQQGDGWGLDADSSRRGDHASSFLHRLAQCILRTPGGQRSVR
jgi:4-carboxymuconolactone decarboxylase